MVTTQIKEQSDRLIRQRILAFFEARDAATQRVEEDVTRRNVARSGLHIQQLREAWGDPLSQHCEDVLSDLIRLAERHDTLDDETSSWIQETFEAHVNGLTEGMGRGLAEMVNRLGIQNVSEIDVLARMGAAIKGKAHLRLETAVGEAKLKLNRQTASRTVEDLDNLVPLLKRAAYDRDLKVMVTEATVERYPLALIMIDGDGFKQVNDEHGHDVGDEVIKGLGEVISRRVRKRGQGYRYGGDEFVLLLPNHTVSEAAVFAETVRAEIEQTSLGNLGLKLTATFGVACLPDHALDPEALFRAADQACLSAKRKGRNRIEIAPPVTGTEANHLS